MTILSEVPDGCGYYYGFRDDDHRQINVRRELVALKDPKTTPISHWVAYVGGKAIAGSWTKEGAEQLALEWMDENPVSKDDQC